MELLTQLGCLHPTEDAELLGFAVGADHSLPQTHSYCL